MKDMRGARYAVVIAGIVCALSVGGAGVMLWHLGDTGAPEDGVGAEGVRADGADGADDSVVEDDEETLFEVLPLFTNENPASGPGELLPSQVSGFSVYWRQCTSDDPKCFFRERRPDGTLACYKLRSGYEHKEGGRSGAEAYGLTEVSADDPW